jgi:peptide/nickel transport system substrate-binding protein
VDYTYIGLNLRDPVLADKRVRQAIAHAVNREAIVKYLRRGLATPAVGVVSPVAWAFEPDVPQFEYNVPKAKQLLDAAGYRDPDGDGPLACVRLSLKTSTDEFYRLQATVIQQDLKRVGIAG